jgi:hypothetical protein
MPRTDRTARLPCPVQVGMSHISAAAAAETLPQVGRGAVRGARRAHTHAGANRGLRAAARIAGAARTPLARACRVWCWHLLQGMKDLNLRDEAARYQQAPQPDMVSSQVRVCVRACARVGLISRAAGAGHGGSSQRQRGPAARPKACCTGPCAARGAAQAGSAPHSTALVACRCPAGGQQLPPQPQAAAGQHARSTPLGRACTQRAACVLTAAPPPRRPAPCVQVFEGRAIDSDNRSGTVITAVAGTGPSKQTFNYATERIVGNGSFGTVFQATCLETAETVRPGGVGGLCAGPRAVLRVCRRRAECSTWRGGAQPACHSCTTLCAACMQHAWRGPRSLQGSLVPAALTTPPPHTHP